jgi:hypothetical protein
MGGKGGGMHGVESASIHRLGNIRASSERCAGRGGFLVF